MECLDIVMVKRHGRFSGESYVVLPGVPPLDFALQKNRSYMGKRYVEVFKAKKMVSLQLLTSKPAAQPPNVIFKASF